MSSGNATLNLSIPDVVRLSTAFSDDRYREFLKKDERNLFYVTPEYRDLISNETGSEPYYFCYEDCGEIVGVLPAHLFVNEKYGSVVNSLPYYGSNGGVILDPVQDNDRTIISTLIHALEEFCRDNNVITSTLIENPLKNYTDLYEKLIDPEYHDERIGQITKFPETSSIISEDEAESRLMDMIDSVRRRNIRKARKSGVKYNSSNRLEDLEFLADLHHEHMQAIDGNGKSKAFFQSIPEYVDTENFSVYVATYNGKKIAGLLLFYFNETVEYYTPAYDIDHKSKQAPSLLVFEAMKDAMLRGYSYWNWGGTWKSQSGVYDYKKRWGTEDIPYQYFVKRFTDRKTLVKKSSGFYERTFPNFYVLPYSELE